MKIGALCVTLCAVLAVACGTDPAPDPGGRTSDVQTQANLRNAITAAKTLFTENESYVGVTPQALAATEPTLEFLDDGTSTGPTVVSTRVLSATEIRIAAYSPTGRCFGLRDRAGESTTFAVREVGDDPNACRAFSIPEDDYRLDGWG